MKRKKLNDSLDKREGKKEGAKEKSEEGSAMKDCGIGSKNMQCRKRERERIFLSYQKQSKGCGSKKWANNKRKSSGG